MGKSTTIRGKSYYSPPLIRVCFSMHLVVVSGTKNHEISIHLQCRNLLMGALNGVLYKSSRSFLESEERTDHGAY